MSISGPLPVLSEAPTIEPGISHDVATRVSAVRTILLQLNPFLTQGTENMTGFDLSDKWVSTKHIRALFGVPPASVCRGEAGRARGFCAILNESWIRGELCRLWAMGQGYACRTPSHSTAGESSKGNRYESSRL